MVKGERLFIEEKNFFERLALFVLVRFYASILS